MKASTVNKKWIRHNEKAAAIVAKREAILRKALEPFVKEMMQLEAERYKLHLEYVNLSCTRVTEFDEVIQPGNVVKPEPVFPAKIRF